jgi:colanic acid biosynthesis glycosyl transferase WcaI
MRLGMVSHWYDPEGGAAAGPGTIARALRDRGHDVDVVTGFPTYPVGRVFDGYRQRPYQREVLEGVTVHRAPIFPSHDTRAARRAANYLSFALSGSAVALRALRDADAVLVYSTPATAAVPALVTRTVLGKPFVVQIQDLWPQTVTSSGFLEGESVDRAERVLHRFCDHVYSRAHTVAVTSPGMAELVTARGVRREKVSLVPNWADEKSFRPVTADPALAASLGLSRPFTVMYAGNFGEMQALETVLDAAHLLRDRPEVGFALVGAGVSETRLREQAERLGLDNVAFVPPQPFSRMSDILALGDVQLVSLKDVPLLRSTLPSKLQANLAAGRPVIGAVAGDAARVIHESGAGLAVAPGDSEALATAVLSLAGLDNQERADLSHKALAYYAAEFSEKVVGDRLSDLLVQAAEQGRGRGND